MYAKKVDNAVSAGAIDVGAKCVMKNMGGFLEALHRKEFEIIDKETVYISASKILSCTVYDLLKNNAQKSIEIKNNFQKQGK